MSLLKLLRLSGLVAIAGAFTSRPSFSSNTKHRAIFLFGKGAGLQDALNNGGGGKSKGGKKQKIKNKGPPPNFVPIAGVSVPEVGKIKAWELNLGEEAPRKFACCRPAEGKVYLVDGECSKCAFDLWQGELVIGSEAKGNAEKPARVACPVCGQMFALPTGQPMGVKQKKGVGGWISGLAQSATATTTAKPIGTYPVNIKVAETGVLPPDGSLDGESADVSRTLVVEADFSRLTKRNPLAPP